MHSDCQCGKIFFTLMAPEFCGGHLAERRNRGVQVAGGQLTAASNVCCIKEDGCCVTHASAGCRGPSKIAAP